MDTLHTYSQFKHSGKFSAFGLAQVLVLGSIMAAVFGLVYGVVIFYSPFALVNVFLVLVFGAVLGFALGKVMHMATIRNTKVALMLGLLLSVVGLCAHWMVWLRLVTGVWLTDFATAKAALDLITMVGPWSVFGWTPKGGTLISIWGLEAAIFCVFGAVMAYNEVADTPYCEVTGKWATVDLQTKKFAGIEDQNIKQSLLANPASIVNLLATPQEDAQRYTQFLLASVPDSGLRTVSVTTVTVKMDGDKVTESREGIISNLVVDATTFDKIKAACEA